MEQMALRILTALATKLLTEKIFAGLIVAGVRYVAKKADKQPLYVLANDIADALDRKDLIAPVPENVGGAK